MAATCSQCDARPTVTFPATRHHRPLAGTKLCCLVTEAHMCVNNLPGVALDSGEARVQNSDRYLKYGILTSNCLATEPHK